MALGDAPSMLKHASCYKTFLRVQMDIGSQCSDNDPDVLQTEKEKVLKGDCSERKLVGTELTALTSSSTASDM